ncbi:hypothetical protein LDL36_09140 [Komagataeibacter sp. FNDCR1]|nr:hypothetical protein [Komagataeibacter sp. FNDCR1]
MNAHAPPNAPRYRTLDMPGILAFLSGLPDLAARLGGTRAQWTIREVSDGNLNNVFVVDLCPQPDIAAYHAGPCAG